MGSPAQVSPASSETEFLESLRSRYEDQGFSFVVAPAPATLPEFFGSYVPDAIAQKQGHNVAIEVKRHQSLPTQNGIREIRRLFEGHSDWQLHVVYKGAGSSPPVTIPVASPAAILVRLDEVRTLNAQGHRRAAFVIGWSLLEAALLAEDQDGEASRPRMPGTVVQTLAMNGSISPDLEARLRPLIQLRNRIVHGDVGAEPSAEEVGVLLEAIENTLALHYVELPSAGDH